jgi:hypothetical protein
VTPGAAHQHILVQKGITMRTILLIILILLLIGALPLWPYSTGWGYYPGGGLGLILILLIVLIVVGRI